MPLLEIAKAQLSFQNPMCSLGAQKLFHGKLASISFTFVNDQRLPCAWKSPDKINNVDFHLGRIELVRAKLLIKAVATLEPKHLTADEDKCIGFKDMELVLNSNQPGLQHDSSNEESTEFDDREKLRRMRISKANKGSTPWNKGKKHSAETLQKIRERTRLAMQDPKVRVKLVNLGHAQSKETRQKIGAGVKMGWERRRARLKVQETCYFQWQNLIAEDAKLGYVGEEELQWNSYETLDKKLKLEWVETVEQRKKVPRVHGGKRKPKPPEQRRKIAEAISAKWADPEYRKRVCSALANYHGIEPGAGRRPRRRPSDGTQTARRSPTKKKATDTNISVNCGTGILTQQIRLKSKSPAYKDPFLSSKLEMIKNIRAQRATAETKQTEAIGRARLLIAEAEKAAKALEVAATKSPIAQASLIEARKLIAEATQTLESIETQAKTESNASSVALTEIEEETDAALEVKNLSTIGRVNGHKTLSSSNYKFLGGFGLQKSLSGDQELQLTTSNSYLSFPFGLDSQTKESGSADQPGEPEQDKGGDYKNDPAPALVEIQPLKDKAPSSSVSDTSSTLAGRPSLEDEAPSRTVAVTKKWVRGRLVEVVEETQ